MEIGSAASPVLPPLILVLVMDNTEIKASPATRHQPPGTLMRCLGIAASLRVAVVLFVLAMILVFYGTWAQTQKDTSIQGVIQDYFRSGFIVWIPLKVVFMNIVDVGGSVPFPGGWLIGGLLLCNLLAAHVFHFKILWKRTGILLMHSGLVLMMLGEFITSNFSHEGHMFIMEGAESNHVDNMHQAELAVVDRSDAEKNNEVVFAGRQLATGNKIQHDQLPFDIEIVEYQANSECEDFDPKTARNNPANHGIGLRMVALAQPETTGVAWPSAYLRLKKKGTGGELGTYLVSTYFFELQQPMEEVDVGGKKYSIGLRFQRSFRDFSIRLVKFTHEKYPGTETPKNYSSDVVLIDPPNEPRAVKIFMNHPLRYNGETFYQVEVLPWVRGTVLQVVRNPGWTLPYLSCILITLGLLVHFGVHLYAFLKRRAEGGGRRGKSESQKSNLHPRFSALRPPPFSLQRYLPWGVVAMAAFYLVFCALPPSPPSQGFRLDEFASFPVFFNGRPQPLDTVARNCLTVISGRQEFVDESGQRQPAIRWLIDVLNAADYLKATQSQSSGPVDEHKVFRIENEEVLDIFGMKSRPGFRYSLNELSPKMTSFLSRVDDLDKKETARRDVFDAKVAELNQHLKLYTELASRTTILAIPPLVTEAGKDWHGLNVLPIGKTRPQAMKHVPITAYTVMLSSFKTGDVDSFNEAASSYREWLEKEPSAELDAMRFEVFFNHFAPFYQAMLLYIFVFLLACLSWLFRSQSSLTLRVGMGVSPKPTRSVSEDSLGQSAFMLGILTLLVHSWAIMGRMYISGRPPITNHYSSAVFIGWGCSILGLFLEYVYRNGVGAVVGSVTGAATLFIGHMLSGAGDTLEVVRAVLDTNFWLATHVVCIAFGYTAMFVAGFIGIVYVLIGLFQPERGVRSVKQNATADGTDKTGSELSVPSVLSVVELRPTSHSQSQTLQELPRMIYGVVCFALLFSFLGTVLGGIWADQSWGRFWGWDPKENGALLIVLMNAVTLHAR